MATKQFDSLFQKLVGEYTSQLNEAPVGFDFQNKEELIKQMAAKEIKYFIKGVEDQLNLSSNQVWNDMVKDFNFVEELFPENGKNPANDESTFRTAITNTLLKMVPKFEEKYQKKLKNVGGAQGGYSSRNISDTPLFNKEFGNRARTREKGVEGSKPKVEAPTSFRPSSRVDYMFEPDVKAGTLSEEELRVYSAVDTGESYTGSELLDYLKDEVKLEPREDLNVSKLSRILTSLMSKGVLTNNVKASEESEIGALEKPHEKEFDINDFPEVKAAIEDKIESETYTQDY